MTDPNRHRETNPIPKDPAAGYNVKSFSDYIETLKRRWRLLTFVFIVIFLPGVFLAYLMPPSYRSTGTFLVKQQSIREDFVKTTVTGYTDEQIQEVGQRVMATSNLRPIIEKYNLFPDVNQVSIGQAIRQFRKKAFYEPVTAEVINPRTGRPMVTTVSFDISFEYAFPEIAQKVTTELTELYIQENTRSRSEQVQATIEFLENDIERNRLEVERTGQALTEFREEHAGNLPNLENYHLQLAERTERQIDQVDDELRTVRDRKIELEGQLRTIEPYAPAYDQDGNPILGSGERLSELRRERLRLLSLYSPEHPDIVRIEREIEALSGSSGSQASVYELQAQADIARSELLAARQRYSDDHPDVRRKTRELETLENQLARARQQPVSVRTANPQAQQLQELINAAASDIRSLNNRRAELVAKLEETETKLSGLPAIAREFNQLTLNNQQALDRYDEALQQLDEAKMAERLESGGSGQRLVLISEPQIPTEPYQPIRAAILILVVVLGIGGGIILATVIDTLDNTVKSSREILAITGAPALAVIPFLENDSERRVRRAKNTAAIGALVMSLAGAILISQVLG
jgi:uncharacterized protein involved in exopolysaccharide biosynthesis